MHKRMSGGVKHSRDHVAERDRRPGTSTSCSTVDVGTEPEENMLATRLASRRGDVTPAFSL